MAYQDKVKYALTRDAAINDLSSHVDFSIKKGPSQLTSQTFLANSYSSSQISWNITPPSENTAISRRILFKSKVRFDLAIGTAATPANLTNGVSVWKYGLRDAFQAFPLQKLITTMTCSINNTSVSINMQDVLPALLQMIDKEMLQEYHGTTPSYLDNYESFYQASFYQADNNPLAGYILANYNDLLMPRGTHPLRILSVLKYGTGSHPTSLVSENEDNYWNIICEAEFTEPLVISPMIFGDPRQNQAAFLGVNNFNLTANIDSSMKRFWSTGIDATIPYTIAFNSVSPFIDPSIIMEFMSLDATFPVPTQLSLPFMDYPRYITGNLGAMAKTDPPRTSSINSLQLDKVPDKIVVFIRRPLSVASPKTSDSFLPIQRVNVTFNNASGLLSTFSQQQLWRMSRKNGCKQSWLEWSGYASRDGPQGAQPYTAAQANVNSIIGTCGGILVIDPALDLSLQQPYLTDGSQGQFQLQMELTYTNQSDDSINPEIVVVIFNSGLLSTVAGNSQLFTGLADMKTVMSVIEEEKGKAESIEGSEGGDRLVGGAGGARSAGARSAGARSAGYRQMEHRGPSRLASLVM